MPTSSITNQKEMELYQAELNASTTEDKLLMRNTNPSTESKQYHQALFNKMNELNSKIEEYTLAINAQKKPRQKTEGQVEKIITPTLGLGWSFLFGVGIILKETVKLTTAILTPFLFPLHFTLDGIRSIWTLYRTARDKAAAQRKTLLGTNIIHIMGLIAASIVTALAITNPFALPVIFMGITAAGMYKNGYVLHQTKKLISITEKELLETKAEIKTLSELSEQTNEIKLKIARLQTQEIRLTAQLSHLKTKRFELSRERIFNSIGVFAVGLLLASAVLTIVFPPAAALVSMAGMLLFASAVIGGVLTSPPVINNLKQIGQWISGLFGIQLYRRHDLYGPVETPSYSPVVTSIPNDNDIKEKDPLLPTITENGKPQSRSHSTTNFQPTFFNSHQDDERISAIPNKAESTKPAAAEDPYKPK